MLSKPLAATICRALILVLSGIGPGCESGDSPAKTDTTPATDPTTAPIRIGHYASKTGGAATFGISTDNGILLAVEECNRAGGIKGRKIEVITYDDKSNAAEAATAVTRLITKDKVTALLGEVASGRSIVGGQIAQRYGIPMITPSSTNPAVTKIGDMIFRVCYIDPFQAETCARFAIETKSWKSAAVLFDKTQAYSAALNDYFAECFQKRGGRVVLQEAYAEGDSDFGAQLTNIRSANVDVVFIPGYYTDVGNIAIQARKLGIECALLGSDGWDSSELAKTAGEALANTYFSNHYSLEEERPEVGDFQEKYKAKFNGASPDGLAALGYDAARVLFDAMVRAPSLDGKEIASAIAATRNFPAVTGTISINSDRDAQKPIVIVGYDKGLWRLQASFKVDE